MGQRFDSKKARYITREAKKINSLLYLHLWYLIDNMGVEEKDYLQIFECKKLAGKENMQIITHIQELPPYNMTYFFYTAKTESVKIFVIDEESHSTMLLANEF